ncbi:MAG: methyltransferase domain-containing protein [Candidatus Micrarchaeota archaeon]|nr:methyltransferase domain-containing protein [Candidatus Micrarchaeota archaeon]
MTRKGETNPIHLPPLLRGCRRGPQVMLPKDIGIILAYCGVGKNSVVVDAGAGSGWLAIALANVCRRVVSYEWREEFAQLAEKNAKRAGVSDSLEVKRKDVFDGIDERDVDLVTLDMADSDKVVPHAHAALRKGGMVFGYLPHVEQARKFFEACQAAGFSDVRMLECIVRDYLVRQAGVRPQNTGLVHTGYIVFATKK